MALFPTEGSIEPAESITPTGLRPEAREYLEKHGCTLLEKGELVIVVYPQGTVRQEIYPRTRCGRYQVHLLDGTELREVHAFHTKAEYFLYLPANFNTSQK